MDANEILDEARKLHEVSEGLIQLAEQNEHLAEALSIVSGNIRHSATVLEVLVAVKLGPPRR
jgi:hypothetical protein